MKQNFFKQLMLGGVGLLALSSVSFTQAADEPLSGNAKRGEKFYFEQGCYACHGYNGIGRHNLANGVSGIMTNEAIFLVYLRARGDMNPMLPTQSMPHYSKESLSDEDALDIYAHIRTFKDNPPEAEKIPALKTILDDARRSRGQTP